MLRREKASFCTLNRVKTHRPCTFLLWLQLLHAQKADSNSLFQRRLLSVKEIIMSQLERRTLPYSHAIFVTCVSWEVAIWHLWFLYNTRFKEM